MPERVDITGWTFGSLTVSGYSHYKKGHAYWKCVCECGKTTTVARTNLTHRYHQSCGCLRDVSGKSHKLWRGCGDICSTWYSKLGVQSRRRGIHIDVSLEHLWELFQNQNGCCALSGVSIHFPNRYKNRGLEGCTASLDRIDSSKGYVVGNVQWVHKDVNFMKHQLTQDRFLELCSLVANRMRSF